MVVNSVFTLSYDVLCYHALDGVGSTARCATLQEGRRICQIVSCFCGVGAACMFESSVLVDLEIIRTLVVGCLCLLILRSSARL